MPEVRSNGLRILVMVGIAGALAIGGSYTLGFTHNHKENVTAEDLTQVRLQLTEVCVKLDLLLEAHKISLSDDPGTTSPE